MSIVNLVYIDSHMIHLQTAIVKENSVSRQSSIDQFRILDMFELTYSLQ